MEQEGLSATQREQQWEALWAMLPTQHGTTACSHRRKRQRLKNGMHYHCAFQHKKDDKIVDGGA